jgi:hypothetical protein
MSLNFIVNYLLNTNLRKKTEGVFILKLHIYLYQFLITLRNK